MAYGISKHHDFFIRDISFPGSRDVGKGMVYGRPSFYASESNDQCHIVLGLVWSFVPSCVHVLILIYPPLFQITHLWLQQQGREGSSQPGPGSVRALWHVLSGSGQGYTGLYLHWGQDDSQLPGETHAGIWRLQNSYNSLQRYKTPGRVIIVLKLQSQL